MTRRSKVVAVVATVAAGAIGIGLLLVFVNFGPPVDRGFLHATLDKATTEAEVEAILGPPGDYSTREGEVKFYSMSRVLLDDDPRMKARRVEWKDDYALWIVRFQPDSKTNKPVMVHRNMGYIVHKPNVFERLRDFFGL